MNPAAVQLPGTASASQFSPAYSPLHPPSVAHNTRVLSSLSTLSACFTGLVIGILGITNWRGFAFYLLASGFSAYLISALKCHSNIPKYVDQGPKATGRGLGGVGLAGWLGLMGVGQENVLGFLLFWIGGYALIHGRVWLNVSTITADYEVLIGRPDPGNKGVVFPRSDETRYMSQRGQRSSLTNFGRSPLGHSKAELEKRRLGTV